jgi:hypothetical protein
MEHWQVLALKIAGLWAESTQDMICQSQSSFVIRKRKGFYLNKDFLTVLLLLAFGGAIRVKPYLLSAARLERLGSVVANLAIS